MPNGSVTHYFHYFIWIFASYQYILLEKKKRCCKQQFVTYFITFLFIFNNKQLCILAVSRVLISLPMIYRNYRCTRVILVSSLQNINRSWVRQPYAYWLHCFFVLLLANTLLNELDDAENLQAEYKKQPCHLERLYGILH